MSVSKKDLRDTARRTARRRSELRGGLKEDDAKANTRTDAKRREGEGARATEVAREADAGKTGRRLLFSCRLKIQAFYTYELEGERLEKYSTGEKRGS